MGFSFFFSAKSENRRVEQVLPTGEGLGLVGGEGGRERGLEGEYGAKNVYSCLWMQK
jgi:hypothetical protein